MTDESRLLLELPRPGGEMVRIRLCSFKGSLNLDARVFYTTRDNVIRPTTRGVSIRSSDLPAMLEALQSAIELAKLNEEDSA